VTTLLDENWLTAFFDVGPSGVIKATKAR